MRRREPLSTDTAPAAARRWLARRDYSQAELRARLEREGLAATDADRLAAELADGWWQSDERFAVSLVRSRARQGKGPRLVRAEFSGHALDEADFRRACDEAEVDWQAAAAEARGLPNYIVADAGRTQVAAGSKTVIAIGPGLIADVDAVTGGLRLF